MLRRLAILVVLSASPLAAQVTPNLGLNIPPTGRRDWGPLVNHNFSTLDTKLGCFGTAVVAGTITYYNGSTWLCLSGNTAGTRVLQETSAGIPSWVVGGGGSTSPGGSSGNLQYNNSGAFGGFTDGTATQVLHGGRAFGPVVLTTDVSGLLPVANGGNGTSTPALIAGTNISITGTWPALTINATGSVSTAFSAITGSTNTSAAMVVGTGASISATGSGTIAATIATALAANPADCSTDQFANAIAASGDLTCAPLVLAGSQFANQGTTTTLLHGNAAGNPSFGQIVNADITNTTIDLTAKVTGVLPTANGGTALSTYTQGDLLYSSASNVLSKLAKDANATRYLSNTGTSNNPAWAQVVLTNGVSGILPSANGGTANAFFTVSGPTTSAKTFTFPDASSTVTTTICSGTVALGTSAISSGAAATTVTATCTGLASTDNIQLDFNASPLAVTGYVPSASGILTIIKWPTANTINIAVVNNTASSVTPGAISLNYRAVR